MTVFTNQSSSEYWTKEARQMAQDNATRDDAPFKRPAVVSRNCVQVGGELIGAWWSAPTIAQCEYMQTAINAYSPEREKAVQELVDAMRSLLETLVPGKFYEDYDESWALVGKARAALAAYEASK